MSKRFPIPAFDYEQFKNLEWKAPLYLAPEQQERMIEASRSSDAVGWGTVQANDAFYERFNLRGENRQVVMCLTPRRELKLVGRSHAWAIQQALVVDSIDAARAKVICEWKTPRPMNTRLGPEDGITVAGGLLYVVCSHRYSDYWLVNRTLVEEQGFRGGAGIGVLSASDDDINDFHACNVWFSW